MTSPALYGQGLSFPPRVGPDGAMVWSAGEPNVRECIATILRTRPGERVERAGFGCGLDRYLFEPNSVATLRLIVEDVQQALGRWEPRISLDDVTAVVNPEDVRAVDITVSYTLVATGVQERIGMTLTAEGTA
ncbi:GPW/gp25 family protein [Micromonospora sp. NPDC005806]|uniref:GPW/gp25 family protein n=1 Tax=Micromonospora sp. NPDC005806 TaxID=3364234 RepID=UPI003685E6BB